MRPKPLKLSELRGFLTLGHIRDATRELSEKALLFETKTTVKTSEGESIPYRQSAVALLNESDREKRRFLENARCDALGGEERIFTSKFIAQPMKWPMIWGSMATWG